MRLVCRQLRRLLGIGQRVAALEQRGVLGEPGLGLTNGVEHHPVKVRQRPLGSGFGLTHTGAGTVGRHAPGQ
ncbi:hypothetical protein D3C78_903430 [compost metagenome]